jgi:hypothetical protein
MTRSSGEGSFKWSLYWYAQYFLCIWSNNVRFGIVLDPSFKFSSVRVLALVSHCDCPSRSYQTA